MSTTIHPSAVVEAGSQLGEGVTVGAFTYVGPDTEIGDNVTLHNHVTVMGKTRLGADCEVFPTATVGAPAQILGIDSRESHLEVGERCVIRECVTLHGGSPKGHGLTKIGDDCLFMAASHVAHDCSVGDKCVFANQAIIAGHVEVGEQVWFGGASAVHQFCRIGDHAFVGGGAILISDVIPYGSVVGNHARLAGLNIVGLKRRGFSRQTIHSLRAAYRMLFADEGTFSERVKDTTASFSEVPEVLQIVDFVRNGENRSLAMPK